MTKANNSLSLISNASLFGSESAYIDEIRPHNIFLCPSD